MFKYILFLFLFLCVFSSAGELQDKANVFGPEGFKVQQALSQTPVSIYTVEATPKEGIKKYTDELAKDHPTFAIVLTSKPREWRISMYPVGVVSAEKVRLVGDRMVQKFKMSRFAEGAVEASRELASMLDSGRVETAPVAVDTRQIAFEHRQRILREQADEKEAVKSALLFIVVVVGAVLLIFFIIWLCKRHAEKRKEERFAISQQQSIPRSKYSPNTTEAQRTFERYTPSERERIVIQNQGSPYYSGSAMHDPLMFYLLLNSIDHSSRFADYPSHSSNPGYSSPSYAAPEQSSSGGSSYSSDSSPSYSDSSGGASSDSGSSYSDSSGGSGGW